MSALSRLAVHHLAVVVRDLDRAEAFYGGALGLPVERRWADADGAPRSVWLSLGDGAFLAIERASPAAPDRPVDPPGWHCVALAIAAGERESFRARLADAGFPVERESPFTLYTRDPEGNLVGLSHYPEAAMGRVETTKSSSSTASSFVDPHEGSLPPKNVEK